MIKVSGSVVGLRRRGGRIVEVLSGGRVRQLLYEADRGGGLGWEGAGGEMSDRQTGF